MAQFISFQPSDFYKTKLYTGTGSSNAITGVGFEPAFIWIKNRDAGDSNVWTDAVRGVTKQLFSNQTSGASTQVTNVTSFDSDGFTLGTENQVNTNTEDFVSWNWKGGTTSGITTDGSTTITPSTYNFNQTSGISVLKYGGNNTSGAKVAHGLGAVPAMIIVKTSNTGNEWNIYHKGVDATAPEDYYVIFKVEGRSDDTSRWNDTAPDSVNFTIGNAAAVNGSSNTMAAYCFAEKSGYSKFGNYKGNASADGPFVYTGFRPAYVTIKNANSAQAWNTFDDKRSTSTKNTADFLLQPNDAASEATGVDGTKTIDLLSNGFKVKGLNNEINKSGDTHIYMAFAKFPFVSSNNIPGTAR